jgi:hypothetical protein
MNRQLKFRVWDNEPKKFEYFELHNITVPDRLLTQDKFTVQQWTGFVDRNGKDVYEGDFLGEKFDPITFYEGKFIARLRGARLFDLEEFWEDGQEPEVIGNIFESRELLNK